MDKLDALTQFEKMAGRVALDIDEIRLYLLLLAICRETGDGEIGYTTVREALGERYSSGRLQRICRHLEQQGLIEVLSLSLAEVTAEKSILTYRILPFERKRAR